VEVAAEVVVAGCLEDHKTMTMTTTTRTTIKKLKPGLLVASVGM
jgi:hypothetical protein